MIVRKAINALWIGQKLQVYYFNDFNTIIILFIIVSRIIYTLKLIKQKIMRKKISEIKILESVDKKYKFKLFSNIKLGQGGFGECFLGEDLHNKQKVAIKVQKNSKQKNYRYQNSTLSKLSQNQNLIKSYQVHLSSQTKFYIVMEYCNMGTLKNLIQKYKSINKRFQLFEINQIMYDILNGYQELIKFGLVHEDIKPSNILVNNNIFKIGDFGLTQKVGQLYTKLRGTKSYIPLQKFKFNKQKVYSSYCSDVYSLGIILFQMIYFSHPYKSIQFQEYCKKKKGTTLYKKQDEKKYYNHEYLQISKIYKPKIPTGIYDEGLLKYVDRMVSHNISQRPTFQQLFQFFKTRICLRISYQQKQIKNMDAQFQQNNIENSFINVSQITDSQHYTELQNLNVDNIIQYIQKRRCFTNHLDKLINPIKKQFKNIKKIQNLLLKLIKKISLVNLSFSKKTYEICKDMRNKIKLDLLIELQKKENKVFFDLLQNDIKQFQQIFEREYEYEITVPKKSINIQLQLTKIAEISKKILESLKHIDQYQLTSYRAIDNLLKLYNIHSLKKTISQINKNQLYKLQKSSFPTKDQIIKKFIDYQISQDLYHRK